MQELLLVGSLDGSVLEQLGMMESQLNGDGPQDAFEVVLVSEFADKYGVSDAARRRFGVCNPSVERITEGEFRQWERLFKRVVPPVPLARMGPPSSVGVAVSQDLEGDTFRPLLSASSDRRPISAARYVLCSEDTHVQGQSVPCYILETSPALEPQGGPVQDKRSSPPASFLLYTSDT
ncbi:uncharacterized protein KNAG_0E00580 [Huiozyma naganishii CBS 8797]|uniref:Uncharacterized protein n=1 Tax=Huiozyma naganishii (strain ATCC MYA-139 / BCRC 22969 / CBS 8797 / KCTC 17520 / NBRC 10181 / NCYC 3082 / Yp74L-3) TaxID=1071383 RepID=J7S7G5_HUIN7|nr:hypothetical protein KNAG_0E00580 [Kazachstania naganishii CBS 8797]CCK70326.1 hypothetical protein KNAG_0E00580 [Kazachstania naganishii CBS 8797]